MYCKIIGYENYSVSSFGKVRNDNTGRILKTTFRGGYEIVTLCRESTCVKKSVHRLVGEAFLKNLHNKKTINHKDGVKSNNNLDNLEWATHSENIIHAIKTKLHSQSHILKFSIDEMSEICEAYATGLFSMRELARQTKTTHNTIGGIVRGITANRGLNYGV